ncbi:MAG: hypothetical protein DMD87_09370 [Candidatus Rokuibacteriota bacterium]|nr:MAG: hypothetical protein DMD87_09370 [Candidatus Rokubacteria bacterium]
MQRKVRSFARVLPPHLEENVRLVAALAELFATAAAERLVDTEAASDGTRPTLRLLALATGTALCAPLREREITSARGRSKNRRLLRPPHGAAPPRVLRVRDAVPTRASSGSRSISRTTETNQGGEAHHAHA